MRLLGFFIIASSLIGLIGAIISSIRHWRGVDRKRIKVPATNELTVREVSPRTVEAVATKYPTNRGYGFLHGGETIKRFSGPLRRQRAEAWLRRLNSQEVRSRRVKKISATEDE